MVCLSLYLLVTGVSPAKTVEPIEVLFGLWSIGNRRTMSKMEARWGMSAVDIG